MSSRLNLLIDLLHAPGDIALATHSVAMPGYPFATIAPFVTDEHHRPVFLISGLAEHTRNLTANPRASLLIARSLGDGEIERVSLMGEVHPIEAVPLLVARYLRYHPPAERFLRLGDFRFHRFVPQRVLTVGGFAKANWLEGDRLLGALHVSLIDEAALIDDVTRHIDGKVLGIDAYGADFLVEGTRVRLRYTAGAVTKDSLLPTLLREIRGRGLARDPH